MPVARGPQISPRSALLVGATGIVIALLLGGMALWVANSSDSVDISLGDRTFPAGQVGAQSREIDDRGPILYQDVGSSGTRDLIVQHIGDDPETGWLAFSARRIGDPRGCFAQWEPDSRTFVLAVAPDSDASCEPGIVFDELGCGLERYPVRVVDGELEVFLNEDFDEVAEAFGDDDGSSAEPDDAGPDLSCPAG